MRSQTPRDNPTHPLLSEDLRSVNPGATKLIEVLQAKGTRVGTYGPGTVDGPRGSPRSFSPPTDPVLTWGVGPVGPVLQTPTVSSLCFWFRPLWYNPESDFPGPLRHPLFYSDRSNVSHFVRSRCPSSVSGFPCVSTVTGSTP